MIHNLRESSPECSILVVSSSTDGQLILKAMHHGAKEFLTQPVGIEELVLALERIGAHRVGGGAQRIARRARCSPWRARRRRGRRRAWR